MEKFHHILEAQQFDRKFLDGLCWLTTHIRETHRTREGALRLRSLLPHKRAMLFFDQPSSRTFLSFDSACQNLGMDEIEIRDIRTSSKKKGESDLDSIQTFASYVDVVIMRTKKTGFAAIAAEHLSKTLRPIPVINAGSGADQHPTQALLDIYTLERSFRKRGGIDNKTIALVGDLKRGRTVRSLAYLMKHYCGVHLLFVSPPQFRMRADIREFLKRHEISYEETEDFDGAVAVADAVYMTRVQDEHDKKTKVKGLRKSRKSKKVDISRFCFTSRHLDILRPQAIVMHPLPRRQELDPACDVDPRVMIWRQERNGMWVRTALLWYLLKESDPLDPSVEFDF